MSEELYLVSSALYRIQHHAHAIEEANRELDKECQEVFDERAHCDHELETNLYSFKELMAKMNHAHETDHHAKNEKCVEKI